MFVRITIALTLLVQLTSCHFIIEYPYWRGNSFSAPHNQYIYPCAGLNQSVSGDNRTTWPLDGGSLVLDLHHPWTYLFVNLGLGSNVTTNFNISLTPQFFNETGNGTICIPKLPLPAGLNIVDGMNASIQVVTPGASGSSLYNCADITFSSSATLLSGDQCKNTTGLTITPVVPQSANGSSASRSSTGAAASASSTAKSAASVVGSSGIAMLASAAGALAFALAW